VKGYNAQQVEENGFSRAKEVEQKGIWTARHQGLERKSEKTGFKL